MIFKDINGVGKRGVTKTKTCKHCGQVLEVCIIAGKALWACARCDQ